jgi:hypothetical protein
MMKKKQETDIQALANEAKKASSTMYNFETLLDGTKGLDEKKCLLWKQIYRNAVEDRESASILFNSAYMTMGTGSTDHISMGATLVKYLEKMTKSNQQLLELSALISKDEEQQTNVDPDELFQRIGDKDVG